MTRMLGVVLLLASLSAKALPIAPQTLWDLSRKADLIVVARVGPRHAETSVPRTYDDANSFIIGQRNPELVRLEIVRVLFGPSVREVDVFTDSFLACPSPPLFIEGETIIAFLSSGSASWSVVGFSHGTLYPSAADLPVIERRIREATAMKAPTNDQLLDWYLDQAADPATRWHGLYPLVPSVDSTSTYLRALNDGFPALSPAQLERLADAFIRQPTTDSTLAMLLWLLADVKRPQLDDTFIGAFAAALAHRDLTVMELAVTLKWLLLRFAPEATVDSLLPAGDDDEELRARLEHSWRVARERLHLPAGLQVDSRGLYRDLEGVPHPKR